MVCLLSGAMLEAYTELVPLTPTLDTLQRVMLRTACYCQACTIKVVRARPPRAVEAGPAT